ncbi:hypothetical protein CRG98_048740, partial [Punica granatum]
SATSIPLSWSPTSYAGTDDHKGGVDVADWPSQSPNCSGSRDDDNGVRVEINNWLPQSLNWPGLAPPRWSSVTF